MKHRYGFGPRSHQTEIRFFLTSEERSLADAYLSSTGGKRATFAKTLFLREIMKAKPVAVVSVDVDVVDGRR